MQTQPITLTLYSQNQPINKQVEGTCTHWSFSIPFAADRARN